MKLEVPFPKLCEQLWEFTLPQGRVSPTSGRSCRTVILGWLLSVANARVPKGTLTKEHKLCAEAREVLCQADIVFQR